MTIKIYLDAKEKLKQQCTERQWNKVLEQSMHAIQESLPAFLQFYASNLPNKLMEKFAEHVVFTQSLALIGNTVRPARKQTNEICSAEITTRCALASLNIEACFFILSIPSLANETANQMRVLQFFSTELQIYFSLNLLCQKILAPRDHLLVIAHCHTLIKQMIDYIKGKSKQTAIHTHALLTYLDGRLLKSFKYVIKAYLDNQLPIQAQQAVDDLINFLAEHKDHPKYASYQELTTFWVKQIATLPRLTTSQAISYEEPIDSDDQPPTKKLSKALKKKMARLEQQVGQTQDLSALEAIAKAIEAMQHSLSHPRLLALHNTLEKKRSEIIETQSTASSSQTIQTISALPAELNEDDEIAAYFIPDEHDLPRCIQTPIIKSAWDIFLRLIASFNCHIFLFGSAIYKENPHDLDFIVDNSAEGEKLFAALQQSAFFKHAYKRHNRIVTTIEINGVLIDVSKMLDSFSHHAKGLDFSIHTLYIDPRTLQLYTPFATSLSDLTTRTLRFVAPSSSLSQRPELILRAVKILADSDFTFDQADYQKVIQACRENNIFRSMNPDRLYFDFVRLFFTGHGLKTFHILESIRAENQLTLFGMLFPVVTRLPPHYQELARHLIVAVLQYIDAWHNNYTLPPSLLLTAIYWFGSFSTPAQQDVPDPQINLQRGAHPYLNPQTAASNQHIVSMLATGCTSLYTRSWPGFWTAPSLVPPATHAAAPSYQQP